MIQAPDLPTWAAWAVALLVLAGATMTLIGSFGLLRFQSFYDRIHPPTIGSSMGMALIVLASILCFSVLRARLSVHEVLLGIFVTLTTPVTFMLLARAALYRDRSGGRMDIPPESIPAEKKAGPPETPKGRET